MCQVQHTPDLRLLAGFDMILLTGGEPLLDPDRTLRLIAKLRKLTLATIYLYTAQWTERMPEILEATDGIQFSLHREATSTDIDDFVKVQEVVERYQKKSNRLYVDKAITGTVPILPHVWKRVKVSKWLTEDELLNLQPRGLPWYETLFKLIGDWDK